MANIKRSKEIFEAIRDTLLEYNGEKRRLNYSGLYEKVNDRLRRLKGKGISHRDFDLEIKSSIKEKRLTSSEDKEAKSKVKPVYFSLAPKTLKQYQRHDILGIDEEKDRRRKLFQLIFFYEFSGTTSIVINGENAFDNFLQSISLSRQDLRIVTNQTDADPVVNFQYVRGMRIAKYQIDRRTIPKYKYAPRRTTGTRKIPTYVVWLPGFKPQEIFDYVKKKSLELTFGSWFRASSVFSHIKFTLEEIQNALSILEKARLIKPFTINGGHDIRSEIPKELLGRFLLADERIQTLLRTTWELYLEKISILNTKYRLGDFDDKDRAWLMYVLGEDNTEGLLKDWKKEDEEQIRNAQKYKKEMAASRQGLPKTESSFNKIREIKFNLLVDQVMEKYGPVLEEYDLPLTYIQDMLSVS